MPDLSELGVSVTDLASPETIRDRATAWLGAVSVEEAGVNFRKAAQQCGARIKGPNDPSIRGPVKFRYYTCSLPAGHEGDHEDVDEHADWPRNIPADWPDCEVVEADRA